MIDAYLRAAREFLHSQFLAPSSIFYNIISK